MSGLSGMVFSARRGRLLKTGQETSYHAGDDGDRERGLGKQYSVLSTGQYSGTSNLDVPHYVATGLAFAATTPGTITDTGNGLVTFLTGDTIVVKGSASNDGVYTISTGGVAGTIRTTEATVLEAAGAVVKLYKRTTHSNNAVQDLVTGRMWSRYSSDAEKVGVASDGKLNWDDAATRYTLHGAAADLQMIAATNTLRIVGGAGEIAAYDVGDIIVCSGFADADNNLPGWAIQSATVNGADLDLVLGAPDSNKLADLGDEAAGGARDIKLICRSIYGYAAAARAVALGGYTDWRVANIYEMFALTQLGNSVPAPDTTAFPSWPGDIFWSSTTRRSLVTKAYRINFGGVDLDRNQLKTVLYFVALIRG